MRRYTTLLFLSLCALLLVPGPSHALDETLTNNTPGFVDDSSDTRTVTSSLTGSLTNVVVTIDFHSIDSEPEGEGEEPGFFLSPPPGGVCPPPGSGDSWSEEISFSLTSPMGTTVRLVVDDSDPGGETYNDNSNAPRVQVTFDDSAANLVGSTNGGLPESGTFRPVEPLSTFNGENPQGTWTLTFGDNFPVDGLCLYGFTLELTDDSVEEPSTTYNCTFDGRLNDDHCGYPIAVYPVRGGGYDIYAIHPTTSEGTLIFTVTDFSGDEQPIAEGVHSFTGQPVAVYVLPTGEIQIDTFYADGKPYSFVIGSRGNYHLAR